MELRKAIKLSMLLALSIILNLLESCFPFFNGVIPGLKLGLANIVIVYVLYNYSFKEALLISTLRVLIMGMLITGIFSVTFWFSLGGAILSIIVMYLSKRLTSLSIVGVSIMGSVSHSLGQIVIAIFLFKQAAMVYYLPWLLLFSVPTGVMVGLFSQSLVKYLKIT